MATTLQKAQQKLSDKFGIPTFNVKGGISTVPTSGKLSNINVGLGSFKSSKALNVAVSRKISEAQAKKLIQTSKTPTKKPASVFNTKEIQLPSQKTISVPKVLSKTTLEAQQRLSDKFGIPTFNLTGQISTVPKDGQFKDIDVGTGSFKTEDSFIDAILQKYEGTPLANPQATLGDTINNFFTEIFNPLPKDTTTNQNLESQDTGLPDESSKTIQKEFLFSGAGGESGALSQSTEGDESFIDSITKDPIKLGLGILAIFSIIVLAGKKK